MALYVVTVRATTLEQWVVEALCEDDAVEHYAEGDQRNCDITDLEVVESYEKR